MRFLRPLLPFLAILVLAVPSFAVPITVNYQGSFLAGTVGDQGLPIFINNFDPDHVRFRFRVPDAASILSINSIIVTVPVWDDGDRANNEEGTLKFVLHDLGDVNI